MELKIEKLGKTSVTVSNGYWDVSKDYDRLTIVPYNSRTTTTDGQKEINTFNTYISIKPVPAGTSLSNTEYWMPFSSVKEEVLIDYENFKAECNKLIEDNYRDLIKQHEDVINIANDAISNANSALTAAEEAQNLANEALNTYSEFKTNTEEELNGINEAINNLNPAREVNPARLDIDWEKGSLKLVKADGTLASITIPTATTSKAGLLNAGDKQKLNNLPNDTNTELSTIRTEISNLPLATQTTPGLLSAQDKVNLDTFFDENIAGGIDTYNEIIDFFKGVDISDEHTLKYILENSNPLFTSDISDTLTVANPIGDITSDYTISKLKEMSISTIIEYMLFPVISPEFTPPTYNVSISNSYREVGDAMWLNSDFTKTSTTGKATLNGVDTGDTFTFTSSELSQISAVFTNNSIDVTNDAIAPYGTTTGTFTLNVSKTMSAKNSRGETITESVSMPIVKIYTVYGIYPRYANLAAKETIAKITTNVPPQGTQVLKFTSSSVDYPFTINLYETIAKVEVYDTDAKDYVDCSSKWNLSSPDSVTYIVQGNTITYKSYKYSEAKGETQFRITTTV